MNRSTMRAWICLAILAVAVTGCATPASPPPPPTPIIVQLPWTHQAGSAGLYAADQKGDYAAEGLAVTMLEGGSGVDRIASVLDGTAQFGIGTAEELLLAKSVGKPVRAIATIFRRSPTVFVALADTGITRPQDFAGKTIRAETNILPSLHAITAWVGITPDQYNVVSLPSNLSLFANGDVPIWGVFVNSFVVSAQAAGYKLNLIYPDDYGVHFYADTLFTTDDLIATNPDLVLRFVRASLKGWTYAVENPEEVPAMVQMINPTADPKVQYDQMIATLPLVNTGEDHIGWMNPDVWAAMEATLREQNVITAPLDVTQVYTMQFLNEIYNQ